MWKEAIEAIQQNKTAWLKENRLAFQQFFFQQNLKPQGKLSKEALEQHYKTKLFKLFLAEDYQGLALALPQGARWIEMLLFSMAIGGGYWV